MRSHPAACGVGIRRFPPRPCFMCRLSPGCVLFRAVMRSTTSAHRCPFTPTVESRHFKHGPPKPPGKSPRVCAYGANVAAIRFSGGKTCQPLFSLSRPAPLRLAQAGRRWGRAAAPPRSGFAGSLRAHPSRHGVDAVSCRLLCAPFTRGNADIFRPEARKMVGASVRKMFCSESTRNSVPVLATSQPWQKATHGGSSGPSEKYILWRTNRDNEQPDINDFASSQNSFPWKTGTLTWRNEQRARAQSGAALVHVPPKGCQSLQGYVAGVRASSLVRA